MFASALTLNTLISECTQQFAGVARWASTVEEYVLLIAWSH